MKYTPKRFNLGKMGIVFIMAGLLLLPAVCFAQQRSEAPIGYYPEGLSGQGCIDSITAKGVVIDDSAFEFSVDVTFHQSKGQNASRSLFRPGARVGYMTNSQKQIESLWYFRSCK
ncbi:MAG: hypothetical protein PVI00_03775 [Desulfobacterales bacterium]|jgi:hypothetical protein